MKKRSKPEVPSASVQIALELLRSQLVDLEAVAHAAEDALQYLPFVPRQPAEAGEEAAEAAPPASAQEASAQEASAQKASGPGRSYTDAHLGVGRLHAMVVATAAASRLVLEEADGLIKQMHKMRKLLAGVDGNGSSRAGENWQPELLYPEVIKFPNDRRESA